MSEPVRTIEIFQKSPSPETFLAGQIVFEEGQPGNIVYGIIEGEVNILVEGKVVETIKRGDVFGEGALVQPEHTRASTAIAKTDCLIGYLDRERFLFAIEHTPMFALELLKSYSTRTRRLKHMLAFYLSS
ncbi:MAG: cyclic nucleotide-binding domain-containing protein [Prochloraceae cyanobacterium]|nr:cyclic nucleotide-binding domain-containing protein [Prochloraceae cyanobacterium]